MQLFHAPNFAALYCERHQLSPDRYLASVFRKALYPHVRYLGVAFLFSEKFAIDREFIRQVGLVHSMAEYIELENSYRRLITHFSAIRRNLYLRVSSRRIRQLVATYMSERRRK